MTSTRQLAAIMFTDIVGYTALMGNDEDKALELLRKNRMVQRPLIEKYRGRWLKEIGDGVLASFNTVSDAVNCAIDIQKACKSDADFNLRIGIHQGEVVFEGEDLIIAKEITRGTEVLTIRDDTGCPMWARPDNR